MVKIKILYLLLLFLLLIWPASRAFSSGFVISVLSDHPAIPGLGAHTSPQINDNGHVVWGYGDEIYYWDGTTVINISNSPTRQDLYPQINNNGHVVWKGTTAPDLSDIYYWDETTVINISNSPEAENNAKINANNDVIWESEGDIYYWDGVTATNISNTPEHDDYAQVNDNGHVVWSGATNTGLSDIYYWNGTTAANISNYPSRHESHPQINNSGHVAWVLDSIDLSEPSNILSNIYYWDGVTVSYISNVPTREGYFPQINDNDQIIWLGSSYEIWGMPLGPYPDIFLWDGATATNTNISMNWTQYGAPYGQGYKINNNGHVVWTNEAINCWDGLTTTSFPFTKEVHDRWFSQHNPQINASDHFVWSGGIENHEIYYAQPSSYSMYFPKIADRENNLFYNSISVQNLVNIDHIVTFFAYEPNGRLAGFISKTVPASGVLSVRPTADITGQNAFTGTVIIESLQPLVAMVSYQNSDPMGRNSYSLYRSATPKSTLLFPKIFDNRWEWESWITIQNIYNTGQNMTVTLYDLDGNLAGTDTIMLYPYTRYHKQPSEILDQTWITDHNGGNSYFQGSCIVTSLDQPLVGLLSYKHGNIPDKFSIYEAVESSNELYFPINRDVAGLPPDSPGPFNVLSVTSTVPQDVTIEAFELDGTPAGSLVATYSTLNETQNFRPSTIAGRQTGELFDGAVKVSALNPLYAVNSSQHIGYQESPDAKSLSLLSARKADSELFFPKVFDGKWAWESKLSVQNTSGVAHGITIEIYANDGTLTTLTPNIPADGVYNLNPGISPAGDANSFFQGAIKVISPTHPVSGVVQYSHTPDASYPDLWDRLEIYNGIVYPVP